jgi:hypothetical protein
VRLCGRDQEQALAEADFDFDGVIIPENLSPFDDSRLRLSDWRLSR